MASPQKYNIHLTEKIENVETCYPQETNFKKDPQ